MMNNLLYVLLMTSPKGGEQNPMSSFIFLGLIILVFYLFMIRPQVRRQKELKNYRSSLQKGDKVITTGGIYGKIIGIQDATILLEIDENVKIKVDKNAVLKDPSDLGTQKK